MTVWMGEDEPYRFPGKFPAPGGESEEHCRAPVPVPINVVVHVPLSVPAEHVRALAVQRLG